MSGLILSLVMSHLWPPGPVPYLQGQGPFQLHILELPSLGNSVNRPAVMNGESAVFLNGWPMDLCGALVGESGGDQGWLGEPNVTTDTARSLHVCTHVCGGEHTRDSRS